MVVSESNASARVVIDVLWWEGAGRRLPHLNLRERRPDQLRVGVACLRAASEAEKVTPAWSHILQSETTSQGQRGSTALCPPLIIEATLLKERATPVSQAEQRRNPRSQFPGKKR